NSGIASEAFQNALKRFSSAKSKNGQDVDFLKSAASVEDVRSLVQDSFDRYAAKISNQKVVQIRKWLNRVLETLHHYANIFDVFVQHHPEYVALVWGAMKFILLSIENRQSTIALISKALSQIAESLPQVELATILYPTDRMMRTVEHLYSSILNFLVRTREWCEEGSVRRLLHSITRPPELVYKDLLDQIAENSRLVDRLAVAGAQAETRRINSKLTAIAEQLQTM
ncbi:hypothetical protein QBC43DRAFT_189396, partial [Cladorrhinum sp. PSN259]